MNDNRRFLLDDIIAMLPEHKEHNWLANVTDEGLYRLWQDLVNLTTLEDLIE